MDNIRMNLTESNRETLQKLIEDAHRQVGIAERNVLENLGESSSVTLVTDLIDDLFDKQRRLDLLLKLAA